MGFFEWAVLLLLCGILARVDGNDLKSEFLPLAMLVLAIYSASFVMTVWHIGVWVWSLFS